MQLWGCNGASNQRWQKDADGALRPLHALRSCLHVTSGDIRQGAKLQVMQEEQQVVVVIAATSEL
jgi:hypothetical protein